MKKSLLLVAMTLFSLVLVAQEEKEVVTGPGYADDVYYSLENGSVTAVARENWDLAFAVPPISLGVSVLTNGGSGVELYTYNLGDTASWATLDTTGMVWTPMYNSIETFEEGAFSAHASVHPDYGWGTYGGMGLITGDSLYIIKTIAGNYKKLAVIVRNAAINMWEFKYANLEGRDEQLVSINTGSSLANFIYYSIDTQEELDREPATADWDLLFTKYWDYTIPYSVTGILTNEDHVLAQEVQGGGLDQTTFVEYEEAGFSSEISIIGSDWKSFNMGTFSYDVNDSVVFFLKTYGETDSTYYKIYFTGFTGMSEGKYTFMQEILTAVSTDARNLIQLLEVYPNPASEVLNVLFDHAGETTISIFDITGRVFHFESYNSGGLSSLTLDIADFRSGLYLLKMDAGDETQVIRFIKR